MELSYKNAEGILAQRYAIPGYNVAFRGRLQNLQRSGFPHGVNTGKGRKALYGWTQVVQLSVALDLIDVGLMPDVAKQLVVSHLDNILLGAASIGKILDDEIFLSTIEDQKCPVEKTVFLSASTHALFSLAPGKTPISSYLSVCTGRDFVEMIQTMDRFQSAEIFIDLGTRLVMLINHIAIQLDQPFSVIATDYQNWAGDVIGS